MARKTTDTVAKPRTGKPSAKAVKLAPEAVPPRKNVVPINLDDEIRRRAYEIYLERGGQPGDQHQDWLLAERQVRQRYRSEQSA
jgi:Protein of unknown function (DUF2934)